MLRFRLGHELPYAFVKSAISYQIGTSTPRLAEILRNSADSVARFLNKATTRPDVVRIATTDKGVMIGIMGRSVTTGTTGRGVTTIARNKEKIDWCECEVFSVLKEKS